MVGFNESEQHKRFKRKMANLLRDHGYTVFGDIEDDEVQVWRGENKTPYFVDVCACNASGILCIEIDGFKGHKSRYSIRKDKSRLNYIQQKFNAKVHRFAFWQLIGMDRKTIEEELELK